MSRPLARRIVHTEAPVTPSPSGLPTRYLVDAALGSLDIFVAEQWLQPGDRVLLHTHPRDEVLVFQSGAGDARLDDTSVTIGGGVTLFVPAGVRHGFRNSGAVPLHVLVVFPGGEFAKTSLLESGTGLAKPDRLA